jgi:hypothetical protein
MKHFFFILGRPRAGKPLVPFLSWSPFWELKNEYLPEAECLHSPQGSDLRPLLVLVLEYTNCNVSSEASQHRSLLLVRQWRLLVTAMESKVRAPLARTRIDWKPFRDGWSSRIWRWGYLLSLYDENILRISREIMTPQIRFRFFFSFINVFIFAYFDGVISPPAPPPPF